MLHVPGLFVAYTNERNRGVFTSEVLQKGDLIEICPIIKIPIEDLSHIHQTCLHDYYFVWRESGYGACIALGYGSLYNHKKNPNAQIVLNYPDCTIHFEATCLIHQGEEICIDYTGGVKSKHRLWFDPV